MKNIKLIFMLMSLFILIPCVSSDIVKSSHLKKISNYPQNVLRRSQMIFSKDDKKLFITRDNIIEILDLSDLSKPTLLNKIVCSEYPKDYVYDFAITSDEKYLFMSIKDTLLVYDISNLHKIKRVNKLSMYSPTSLAITLDDRYLYVSGKPTYGSSKIQIYNIKDVKYIAHVETFEQYGFNFKISPNGKMLFYAIGSHHGKALGIADISNPEKPRLLDETASHFNNRMTPFTSAGFEQVSFSSDSKKLYIAGNQAGVMVYDISKNRLNNIQLTAGRHWSMMFNSTEGVYSLALDKEKNILYLAGIVSGEKKHVLVDGATKHIKSIKGVTSSVLIQGTKIALSNKGNFFVLRNSYGKTGDYNSQTFPGLDFYLIKFK